MPREEVSSALVAALLAGDDVALARLLDIEARLTVDTGDRGGGSVRGRARVIRTLERLVVDRHDAALEAVQVNGCPGLALRRDDGTVIGVLAFEPATDGGGPIAELWLQAAPGKLAHWNRRCAP
ncbi:hypothetical protein [Agromyces sp. GXS1127]|uniref:hypothetical protein n=1 Tax=Agromyces sp. GXS1127 TaxID=3424181 RepID=UPI003D316D93